MKKKQLLEICQGYVGCSLVCHDMLGYAMAPRDMPRQTVLWAGRLGTAHAGHSAAQPSLEGIVSKTHALTVTYEIFGLKRPTSLFEPILGFSTDHCSAVHTGQVTL